MPTGKPNFNLNSYGIKYLSKEEVQEFLEKRTQGESIRSQGETRTRPLGTSGKPMDSGARQAGQHRGSTAGLKQGEFTPSLAGRNQIDATINTPKPEAEKPSTPTSSTISAPNAAGDKKLQGGTRSQFMSREDTTPKSNYAKQIAGDIKEARGKVDESGIVSSGGDQSVSATSQGKKVPAHRIKPLYGKNPDGSDKDDSKATPPPKPKAPSLGSTIGTGKQTEKKQEETEIQQNTTGKGKKGLKQMPKHVGDAPKGVKSETELVDGRNTKVGVGSKAHKKLEKDPQGELTSSQKPKEDKPDGRKGVKVDLNAQNRTSRSVTAHNKRGKENSKWYSEEQRAAYKKIDSKDRNAQAKFHSEQEKKYGKSVDTPKKLSSAGQAIKDKLKKSNDIILDMNIMKLDLMKGKKDPLGERLGSVIGKPKNITNDGVADYEKGDDNDFFSLDDKALKSQAEETIFKAISLKLDLMNKKDEWDKNERNNENRSRRGRGSPDKSKLPFGTKQQMLHSQAVRGSGKGLKTRENLNPKPIDPKKQTFGEDSEEYGKIYDMQNERTLKMNIMKLDGFAEESASTRRATNYKEGVRKLPKTGTKSPIEGDGQGTWNTHNYPNITDDARLVPSSESTSYAANDDNERERIQRQGTKQLPKGGKSPKDLGKSANETLFKAISLKLDLMKEYDRSKDVLRPEGVKEGKGKISYETPCVNCGRPYKKGETELNDIMESGKRRRAAEDRKIQEEYYNN